MNQLAENNPFLMQAIEEYPEVRKTISKGRECAICGKLFLTTWMECVEFVSPSKVKGGFYMSMNIRHPLILFSYLNQPILIRLVYKN